MSHSSELLKLLEPAVRPVGSTALSANRPVSFESKSFDALLAETQISGAVPADVATLPQKNRMSPLSLLLRIGAVENTSLRRIIAASSSASRLAEQRL